MTNSWLQIPAAEYDQHMAHSAVRQREFLDSVFEDVLREYQPKTLAVVGCATGGGLHLVDPRQVERVVAMDINPEYLALTGTRFLGRLPMLELLEANIETCELEPRAFDLIHCALVLEYVDATLALQKMARWLAPAGVLVVVLQLPSPHAAPVTETGCKSLQLLEMELRSPDQLRTEAKRAQLTEVSQRTAVLDSGKNFYIGQFMLDNGTGTSLGT